MIQVNQQLEENSKRDQPIFFVFNDIDNFIESENFLDLLQAILLNENHIIIASSRGNYFNYVWNTLGSEITEYFYPIKIESIDNNLKNQLEEAINNLSEPINYIPDDTIGSYFVALNEMDCRYRNLKNQRENNDDSLIKFEFLRSSKCIEIWKRGNRGNKKTIIEYVNKRLVNFYNKEVIITPFKWEKIIEEVGLLGFLHDENDRIIIEPAYLDRIIVKDESEEQIAFEIASYYLDNSNIGKLIYRVSTDDLAWKLYDKFVKQGSLKPDCFIYSSLLSRTNDPDRKNLVLEEIQQSNIELDIYTYNILIGKTENYNDAWKVYQEILTNNIYPDECTFNKLSRYLVDFNDAWKVYQEIFKFGIKPSKNTFYSLLKRTDDIEKALKVFDAFCSANYQPDLQFIESIFGKLNKNKSNIYSKTIFNQVMRLHEQMCNLNIKHSPYTLKQLLACTSNFDTAWNLYKSLKKSQRIERVSPTIFTELMGKAKSLEKANQAFQEMLDLGLSFDCHPMNKLMSKAPDFNTAWIIFEQMKEYKIYYDRFSFQVLVEKAYNIEERNKVIEVAETYFPNITSFLSHHFLESKTKKISDSISHSQSFDNVLEQYFRLLDLGINPSTYVFNQMLFKASCLKQILKLLGFYLLADYKLDHDFFEKILRKINSLYQLDNKQKFDAYLMIDFLMMKYRISYSHYTFSLLIRSSPNFAEAWKVYLLTKNDNRIGHFSSTIFTNLMKKASTFKQANIAYKEMLEISNIHLTCNPFNKLMNKAPNFETAWIIFEQMKDYEIKSDKYTFEILIDKARGRKNENIITRYVRDNYPEMLSHLQYIIRKKH